MSQIVDTNEPFNFDKITLSKPTSVTGGNHFIRILSDQQSLYLQPPKCKTKQGIIRAGKRFYTDLMFSNENEKFIQWMENLENHCQKHIFNNRKEWFEGEMEMHDIENYFTSPLKIYKSGKYYIARVNITPVLGKSSLKIYDENENEVSMESLDDKTNIMTILEIQGIKCSSRSFQIEIEIKQIMVLNPVDIFEKCLLLPSQKSGGATVASPVVLADVDTNPEIKADSNIEAESPPIEPTLEKSLLDEPPQKEAESENVILETASSQPQQTDENIENNTENGTYLEEIDTSHDGMQEIDFNLEELVDSDPIQIKERNDVYYEMYREARRKAKIARDLALSSYLEAKRIKNTYMLDDIKDSDESDLETDDEYENEISQSQTI